MHMQRSSLSLGPFYIKKKLVRETPGPEHFTLKLQKTQYTGT